VCFSYYAVCPPDSLLISFRAMLKNAMILLAAGVQIATAMRYRAAAKMALKTALSSTACPPGEVSETDDGECQVGGVTSPFFCCNALRSCRRDANAYLEYYSKYLQVYEESCSIKEDDFRVSRDGQSLTLVEESKAKVCAGLCTTDRQLQEKEDLEIFAADLGERCNKTVEKSVWQPQLDGADWPAQKVKSLDRQWDTCGQKVTTTTTTAIFSTTLSTTVTFTAQEPKWQDADMSFMGGDTVYQGHANVGWSLFSKARSIRNNIREEVTRNHFCAKRGARDQTYYASSMCYWIPLIKNEAPRSTNGVGLAWTGSQTGGNGPICSGIETKAGKCVKCSTCHNNAISTNGRPNATSWAEEIALPSCKTETEIEEVCLSNFSLNNADLIKRTDDCKELEAKKESAVSHHAQVEALIPALENLINNDIPRKIATLTNSIKDLSTELRARDELEYEMMMCRKARDCPLLQPLVSVTNDCQAVVDYRAANGLGYPQWWSMVNPQPNTDTYKIVAAMKTFVVGDRPDRSIYNYDKEINFWDDKVACGQARDALASSNGITNIKRQEKDHLIKLKRNAEAELETRKKQLEEAKLLEPILRKKKEDLEAEWNGTKVQCESDYKTIAKERPTLMSKCVPSYYGDSCEKKCIEIQNSRGEGCGIMEGAMPNDKTSRGGVTGGCLPPFASWVKAPFTYDRSRGDSESAKEFGIDIPEEQPWKQCSRYFDAQAPRHTQQILMRGSMAKQGRWWKWNTRFWILESGDAVRSAVLRYWEKDPASDRRTQERVTKKIFVWDAKSVSNSGRKCFKLNHFYRSYKLCPSDKSSSTRDKWVRHLKASIKFPQ